MVRVEGTLPEVIAGAAVNLPLDEAGVREVLAVAPAPMLLATAWRNATRSRRSRRSRRGGGRVLFWKLR